MKSCPSSPRAVRWARCIGLPGLREQLACLGDENVAGLGELDDPLGAVDEADLQLLLQRLELLAEAGLRHVAARGGTAEMQLLGKGDEAPEAAAIHTGL